jgi:hypothetical protein
MRLSVHNRLNTDRSPGERSLAPTLLLICGVLLISAQAAQAGVIVDPNGPASKQYSADLQTARRQAGGGGGNAGVPGSGEAAPLFGQGVIAKSASNGAARDQAGDSASPQQASPAAASIGPSGGGRNALAIAAIAIGVLLGGGLIAFVAHRNAAGRGT